jgi:hypothetical protein
MTTITPNTTSTMRNENLRYEIRYDHGYMVWDTYLLKWMQNEFGDDIMTEGEAETLASELNS